MSSLRFQDPLWLLALVPVVLVVLWQRRRQRRVALVGSSLSLWRGLPVTAAQRLRGLLPVLRIVGLALLVLGLARPQQGQEEHRVRTEGVAILMCLDRSGSMQAMDFEIEGERVTRLEVARAAFRDFVDGSGDLPGRPDDLIGLVAFGGFAESLCPLTLDHGTLLSVLDTVQIPTEVRDARGRPVDPKFQELDLATAIGDALARGADRLREVEARSKVLVLLSDGENTAGVIDPLQAAEAAKALGVKVYTIGIGSTGYAPFPLRDGSGRIFFERQLVRLDEDLLTSIAEITGGAYFNVRDAAALRDVYAQIDALEKTETEMLLYTEYRELYSLALLPGTVFLLLELLLRATRFSGIP